MKNMKKIFIFSMVFCIAAIACTKNQIEENSVLELTSIDASFDSSTKCIYNFGAAEISPSWEKGDTITVVAGLNCRYFVADNSGFSTSFHISSEHDSPLEAHVHEMVYAITGKYELKDYTYALTNNGSLSSQSVSGTTFPMNIMRATSSIESGKLNLRFSHILSYLHIRIPKNVVSENNYELRVCCPNEFLFYFKGDDDVIPDCNLVENVHVTAATHPYIDGDNWYEGSQSYAHLLLNIRDGEFVDSYYNTCDHTFLADECLIRFPSDVQADADGFVDAIVGIKSSETINYLIVFGSEKPYKPLYSKAIPEGGIKPNTYINVNLEPIYMSTDFSRDGEVKLIQESTVGRGIDLVFMADFFIDKDMEDNGQYESYVKESVDYFFSYEPYTQYRERFNVYCVKAVCPYSNCRRSDSPLYSLDGCLQYGRKAITDESSPLRVVVLHNPSSFETVSRSHASSSSDSDFCVRMYQSSTLDHTLVHELSHGLAHLYDEYQELADTPFSEDLKQDMDDNHAKGFCLNVDYRTNPSTVLWADIMADSRFASEKVGIYDKAWYSCGLYKSSEQSIMNDCHSYKWFNAQSRKAIYINLMKASEGDDWQYDYEEFVSFDETYRKNNSVPCI